MPNKQTKQRKSGSLRPKQAARPIKTGVDIAVNKALEEEAVAEAKQINAAPESAQQAPEDHNEIPFWLDRRGEPDKAPVRERLDDDDPVDDAAAADHLQNNVEPAEALGDDDAAVDGIEVIQSIKQREAEPNIIYPDEVPPSEDTLNNAAVVITETLARQKAGQERDWRRIGEQVALVVKVYGENRIGELAKKVVLAASTLRRYRDVAELAKEIESKCALGRTLNFSAVRELLTHPDVAEREFRKNPCLTKKEAVKIKHRLLKNQKATPDGRRKDMERAIKALVAVAETATRLELKRPTDCRRLKESLANFPEFAAKMQDGEDALHRSRDFATHIDQHIAEAAADDNALEAAQQRFAQKRAEAARARQQSADDHNADDAAADGEADDADAPEEKKETRH